MPYYQLFIQEILKCIKKQQQKSIADTLNYQWFAIIPSFPKLNFSFLIYLRYIFEPMNQIESCELLLTIKQLKLTVKFPCKLTFQHGGKSLTQEISSGATNVFSVNKDISVREERPKDTIEININLATDKGGNIMAGIMRLNLKDINSSQGQLMTISLQKCLDPYATCTLHVKSVKINKSRVKTINISDDKRSRMMQDNKFQTKSEAPGFDGFKSRTRVNEAEQYLGKRVSFNNVSSPGASYLKEKALSTAGFKVMKDVSFDREELGSRFKHLNRKVQEEDSKTVITGRWRQTDQVLKSTMEANQKALKMEILKYKTKLEDSERNSQEKQKQIKGLKDQISQLNRQMTEKHYLVEEISTKNSQIAKLEDANKQLSKQFHEDRNRIIDLQRQMQEQKSQFLNQITKLKEEHDKREYDLQKQIYEKREEIKEMTEQTQYKVNQIKKMKVLIEELEKSLEVKSLEFEKIYTNEKNEHNKTRTTLQVKLTESNAKIESLEAENGSLKQTIRVLEDQMQKICAKLKQAEDSLKQTQDSLQLEISKKEKISEEKRILAKNQEETSQKLKQLQKEYSMKEKQSAENILQLNETNNLSKKKIGQFVQKNKTYTTRIQQLENKCNILAAAEEKLKRGLDIAQKQNRNMQQNEKVISKNLKLKDDRILQLERQLSDIENKITMKESLGKKDLEYKVAQMEKLTSKLADLEKQHEKEREENEAKRLEIMKNENKIKMLEETNHRLNEQITEIKLNFAKKEEDLRANIHQLTEQVKQLEAKETENNKDLHTLEMEKISLKNELIKSEKMVQSLLEKQQRSKKRQVQLQSSIKALSNELQSKNEEIVQIEAQYKILENDFRLLQADKSKHQKITTIISEEKDNIKNDVSKLKKQIEKRDQKQEQYLSQIKNLKEQITKIELKLSIVTKQSEKFKSSISESVKSVLILKQSYLGMDNVSQSNLQFSRSIQRSRVLKNQANDAIGVEESKLADVIQNFSRDSHQTIAVLTEQIRKLKKEKDSLERQNNNLNNRLKDTQEELSKTVKEMSNQIENIITRTNDDAEQYEEKLSYLEKELIRKEKALGQLMGNMQEITNIHQNEKSSHQISVSDLLSKIESLKFKIVDLERKDESNGQVFVSLQEKIAELEQYNMQLNNQNEILSEQIQKKERTITLKTEQNEDLLEEMQSLKKQKSDQSIELLSLKESLSVEKQNSQRLINQLKSQESKNSQLKLFQNQILKEKQSFLKKDFQKSQKLYSVQEKLQYTMIELAERNEQLTGKIKTISEQKDSIRQLQVDINNIQIISNETKLNLQKEKERAKDKERKITEKDAQIQNLNSTIKKNSAKYETQLKKLTEQYESLSQKMNKQKLQHSIRCQQYQLQLKSLKESEKRMNELNVSLEEQIYFQKQTNALNNSKIDELKQQINQLQIEDSRLNTQINILNDQVKEKEENLFALSGKLYASDNRLQSKEEEFKQRLEKVEMDWRYKIEQICEEYEHKLEIIEREKNYVRNGMNDFNESIEKLESEKIALKIDHEREKQAWELKIKRLEEEKLTALIEKNKQIEKLREVIQDLEEKIKRKDFESKLLEDEKKKIEEKYRELKAQLQRVEERKNQGVRMLQKEVDQLKRKEGQLKRFKEALRNGQWTTEREIKKHIQNATKSMASLTSEAAKGEVMELMRGLEAAMVKLALSNIDDL